MKQIIFGAAILVFWLVISCNNDDDTGPTILEPITFLEPDSTSVKASPGSTVNMEVQLTTDRIIDSLVITYHIDTTGEGFNPDVDPQYVYQVVKWAMGNNIQTFNGSYMVSDSLVSFDVVRLIFNLRAEERFYQKTLKINVR